VLLAIVVLRLEPETEHAATAESGAAAAAAVAENAYCGEVLGSIYAREIFEWAPMTAGQAKVFDVRRPHGDWTVDPLCSTIEELAHRHDPGGGSA
jgi:hypothetical protein